MTRWIAMILLPARRGETPRRSERRSGQPEGRPYDVEGEGGYRRSGSNRHTLSGTGF